MSLVSTLLFLHYRAGSTLLQHLLGLSPFFYKLANSDNPELLYTDDFGYHECGNRFIKHVNLGNVFKELKCSFLEPHILMTHVGNWWGECTSNQIPAPFESLSQMKMSSAELAPYQHSWQFCTVLRDGRNQVASFFNFKGGIEKERRAADPHDYFIFQCMAFRNRARIALECQESLDSYRIFKFEDITQHPVETISTILNYIGIEPNADTIAKRFKDSQKGHTPHSSFNDNSQENQRWHLWTPWQIEIFKEIAGQELIDLGYEKDFDWISPCPSEGLPK